MKEDKFKYNDGLLDQFNNFIDSINIIKYIRNGFSSIYMKIIQRFFWSFDLWHKYVLYSIIGGPITILSKI